MEMNNEIRRIKAKLKLFEEEGFNWVVADIFDELINKIYFKKEDEEAGKLQFPEKLKQKYLEQLQKLSPPDIKQTKLEI